MVPRRAGPTCQCWRRAGARGRPPSPAPSGCHAGGRRRPGTAGDAGAARLWEWADARGVPLQTILVTVAVVAITLPDRQACSTSCARCSCILVLAAFIALLLDPLVLMLQRVGVQAAGLRP